MKKIIKNRMLTGTDLKIIALVSMTIDHIGAMLFPEYIILRIIGRLAFPIYCFLLVEGFFHTSNRKNYLIRLGIFAMISEIPFDLAFSGKIINIANQNVFFTLFIGLLVMHFCEFASSDMSRYLMCAIGMVAAWAFQTDYGAYGVAMILGFYLFRKIKVSIYIFQIVMNVLVIGGTQAAGALALIPIEFYNGERGGDKFKMMFYWWYPLHLMVLYIIKCIVM